jgi:hypothetical protein
MKERMWLANGDPHDMLYWLTRTHQKGLVRTKAGRRKLRLFGCHCCRLLWDRMTDPRSRAAVETAERLADGLAGKAEAEAARAPAEQVLRDFWAARMHSRMHSKEWPDQGQIAGAARAVLSSSATDSAWADLCYDCGETMPQYPAHRRHRAREADAVRCLFGNPFRPADPAPAWRSWNGGAIPRLAQAAYDNRDLPAGTLNGDRIAILADALEAAGADTHDALTHLRGPGPHPRGCWAVDLLLGKA